MSFSFCQIVTYCVLSEETNMKITYVTLTARRICDNMTMLITYCVLSGQSLTTFFQSKLLKMCHILPKATFFLLSMRFQCVNKKEHRLIRRKDEKSYFWKFVTYCVLSEHGRTYWPYLVTIVVL